MYWNHLAQGGPQKRTLTNTVMSRKMWQIPWVAESDRETTRKTVKVRANIRNRDLSNT
jgi:hypothetical protein